MKKRKGAAIYFITALLLVLSCSLIVLNHFLTSDTTLIEKTQPITTKSKIAKPEAEKEQTPQDENKKTPALNGDQEGTVSEWLKHSKRSTGEEPTSNSHTSPSQKSVQEPVIEPERPGIEKPHPPSVSSK